ncbi:MAG: N-acetyl-gamma-glutamyl-phosphate reductase [Chloroflexi bacterium]|nr:MAG: N-acetyl-gamma-glutamyl-phosphate reductase [Chloroflexota bacterium]TMG67857.1 MAG: N-acetyl-gamma-glutamyl-phosphate reductase [Chloroflexota bacterium]
MTRKVKAAVAGANGYAGMTAVNLLARHPAVELTQLTSRSYAGKPYSELFPLLDLTGEFVPEPSPNGLDVIFSCLPHNVGAARVETWLDAGLRVIDMSADFRLRDASQYPTWYQQPHPSPALLERAVLGLPELHAEDLKDAQLIAVPGCYSTASILALAPAVSAGLVGSDVIVDAKSGVSGAGRSPGLGVHFSEVNETLGAYAIEGHRHLPEIVQELDGLAVTFVPHLVPMTRGILATCYFDLKGSVGELQDAYREFYAGQPFTRVTDKTPTTKLASHSNLCLVNVAAQGRKAVVTAALDNLIKGASGQGVECFNIAFGFDRTTALTGPLQWP